jgi:hypothetical protein
MADQHVDELEKARSALVKMRLDWAKALSAGYKRGETENAVKAITEVQQAIEAVDRAIEELRYEEDEDEDEDEDDR